MQSTIKKSVNLDAYLSIKPIDRDRKGLCSAFTSKGTLCTRKKLPNSNLCKLHRNKKNKLEKYQRWLKVFDVNIRMIIYLK